MPKLPQALKRFVGEITPPFLLKAIRKRSLGEVKTPILEVEVHGAKLKLPPTHNLPHYVAAYPLYDSALPAIASFLKTRKRSVLNIVDVGANFGDTAAIIAACIGADSAQFTCIEADEQYIPWLLDNTRGLQVEIVWAVAGPSSGHTRAGILQNGVGSSAIIDDANTTARMVAVDELVSETVDLLKIDTDGYELQVVLGATRTLSQEATTAFVEYSPPHIRRFGRSEPADLLLAMREFGFKDVLAYDNIGVPIGIYPTDGDTLLALTRYSERRPDFYLDLLFDRDRQRLEELFTLEVQRTKSYALRP